MCIAMNLHIPSIPTAAPKNPVLTLTMIIIVTVVILGAIMAPIILLFRQEVIQAMKANLLIYQSEAQILI